MKNDPMNFDEQAEVFAGVVLALGYVLSVDQRDDAVRLLRTHADQDKIPERAATLLRRLADVMNNPPRTPTRH
jgi:hypothetical protein